jgi:hypothetical protein
VLGERETNAKPFGGASYALSVCVLYGRFQISTFSLWQQNCSAVQELAAPSPKRQAASFVCACAHKDVPPHARLPLAGVEGWRACPTGLCHRVPHRRHHQLPPGSCTDARPN